MAIVWSSEAAEDFLQALAYLQERNPAAAIQLAERVDAVLTKLTEEAIDGPAQRLRSGKLVRSWPVHPFRLYYQRAGERFLVVRLYHQKRQPIVR